jgi:colanic acid/amylovoran biosynthesis protein
MHSNIFALSEGVPVIAIGYQHKTRGIAEMAGMGDWVIEIQAVDETLLVARMEALWEQRLKIREQLLHTIPVIIKQASRAGSLVQQDYNRIRLSSR